MTALVLIVPAFLFHVAPRFPGSLAGGVTGIAAALLFVSLLSYWIAKRIPWVKERTKNTVSVGVLLTFHVYAGAIGALLGIVHSGHKFVSPLGIALVVSMLVVVGTGFIGRYYLAQIGEELRDQQKALGALRTRYDRWSVASSRSLGRMQAISTNCSARYRTLNFSSASEKPSNAFWRGG